MSTRYSQFSSLSLEQVDELFRKYDKNGDGIITKEELTGFISQIDLSSTQSKTHASKPLLPSKPLPPKTKTNYSNPNENANKPHASAPTVITKIYASAPAPAVISKPHASAPAVISKPHTSAPTVISKPHASAPTLISKPHASPPTVISMPQQPPKEKIQAKANESEANTHKLVKEPTKKHGAKVPNEDPWKTLPAKMFEDKALKAPAKDLPKNGPVMRLNREHIKDIFREHDVDGDGYLDYGELTMAFHFLGSEVLPCYLARKGIACADANGDGLISEEELDKLIDYAEEIYGDDLVF